jgi:hypothetical protein
MLVIPAVPDAQDGKIRKIMVRCQPGKSLMRLHLNKQARGGRAHCNSSSMRGVSKRIVAQGWLGKKYNTFSKK